MCQMALHAPVSHTLQLRIQLPAVPDVYMSHAKKNGYQLAGLLPKSTVKRLNYAPSKGRSFGSGNAARCVCAAECALIWRVPAAFLPCLCHTFNFCAR